MPKQWQEQRAEATCLDAAIEANLTSLGFLEPDHAS